MEKKNGLSDKQINKLSVFLKSFAKQISIVCQLPLKGHGMNFLRVGNLC